MAPRRSARITRKIEQQIVQFRTQSTLLIGSEEWKTGIVDFIDNPKVILDDINRWLKTYPWILHKDQVPNTGKPFRRIQQGHQGQQQQGEQESENSNHSFHNHNENFENFSGPGSTNSNFFHCPRADPIEENLTKIVQPELLKSMYTIGKNIKEYPTYSFILPHLRKMFKSYSTGLEQYIIPNHPDTLRANNRFRQQQQENETPVEAKKEGIPVIPNNNAQEDTNTDNYNNFPHFYIVTERLNIE